MHNSTPMGLPHYTELDCLSNFTFLRGASHPEELIERAAHLGYQALALADECSLAGIVRAWVQEKKHALHFIAGSRFQCGTFQLIALAQSLKGYENLSEIITLARRKATKGSYAFSLHTLLDPEPVYAHLQGLPDCSLILKPAYVCCPQHNPVAFQAIHHALLTLKPLANKRVWLGLQLPCGASDTTHLNNVLELGRQTGVPVVALGGAEMHVRSRQPLHDALAALRLKKTVQQCGFQLVGNAEHHLRSRLRLAALYPAHTLNETLVIRASCQFDLAQIRYQYPREIVPAGYTATGYLRHAAYEGAQRRYPNGLPENVRKQLESELAIIQDLEFEPYFLTVFDIVQFARQRNILCQGRGSAANSAVCYCLGITEVDPASGNTLFARFISHARKEPPDIDVDFEHQRREEVMQYIYEKYGRNRAALAAVVITYRTRSALRDAGRALGIATDTIASIAKSHHHWVSQRNLAERMAAHGLDPASHAIAQWISLTHQLLGFPRHLSQHPGGFVISNTSLARLVPIENAAMPGRSIVQWDKDDLDAMGLLKVDVLALGMLSALRRCLDLLEHYRGHPLQLHDIPANDPATFAMIRQADTVGVFQIESRAQMSMLPRLQPQCFYDLVVQVAIVRPGPIQGGMVHPYLRRRMGLEAADSPTPEIAHILKRTLGVPIFQEQAMQIAMQAAGFSADEADQLRRAMAAWKRTGGVDAFRQRLLNGLLENNCPPDFAQRIVQQLEGFGEYGFPESHAASFAKLAYISAWFKCHEPEAFLAALLNSQPMGFYSPSQLVLDARRHRVTVLPVSINHSQPLASLENNGNERPAVRLGLNQIKGLSAATAQRINMARQHGVFSSLHNLAQRAGLNRRDLNLLAQANALGPLAGNRHQAAWQAATPRFTGLLARASIHEPEPPPLHAPTPGQSVVHDYRALGLTLGPHPLSLLRAALSTHRFLRASELADCPDRRLVRACGLVTTRQRPQTAKGTVFVTLEDETGQINVIVHAGLAQQQSAELIQPRLMGVYGVWQRQHNVCHLLARRLVNLDSWLGELPSCSRNFH
jgi:error-prone DNA polymerase